MAIEHSPHVLQPLTPNNIASASFPERYLLPAISASESIQGTFTTCCSLSAPSDAQLLADAVHTTT
jgi:hypothetical protein